MTTVLTLNIPALNQHFSGKLWTMARQTLQFGHAEKNLKKPSHKKFLPPHIAHICLCLLTHKPTQRQSQKSAIANALLAY